MRNVDKKSVPAVTVPRLALYLRKLREVRARGVERVSSKDLAEMIGLNAAQIRKDFSYFGEFGTRGVGYEVARLVDEISHCLGLDQSWNVVIVGAGLLGTALARYRGFSEQGFRLVGMFDSSGTVIGASYGTGRVRSIADLEDFCRAERVDIALVTVPAGEADGTVARLAAAGVKAVLNFAPIKVHAPEGILVRQVDLSSELMSLTFYLDREPD
ncbi:MAG: redox-sensing transcriptional repressor Rex [Actinobacteria bacterium]|nr:redox-sensing transcriptional repressor Rex [Actinomycetota bacterium]